MKNYTKITSKFIEDIQSNVTIYKHNKTNARICTIENDDNNKVFSIAFRTPAINDGGLTHILEHSVLCGSKNYPVKDPFVELLKSSLNTFLNAFTFPDKTMYPCASQNLKDFKNLMSVYMDAVFYPQIYEHEEIFMQEGWHYHILDENEPITYNGVVYNEMKGAFSDPQQILFRQMLHSLFPDTTYSYESGGDPEFIPDLTYEEFKEFHSKFYHPSNSYIFVYGNCDMEERLNWLDEAYLNNFEAIDFDTTVKYQKPFDKPVVHTEFYPVAPNVGLENKTFLSYNVAFPSTLDVKLMMASSILVDVLLNNPGAPLKQAIIDAKLGEDVMAAFDDGLLQPMLGVVVVNSNQEKQKEFISLLDNSLREILNNGLDHDAIRSLINYQEFKAREDKFGRMPKGLNIQMVCLNSWLYDENDPFSKVEAIKYYDELRKDLDEGYFESIIEKYILNNTHKTYTMLVPSHTVAAEREKVLTEKLADYKASLSKEDIQELIKKNQDLAAYQSEPSTLEEIATLPKLELEDLTVEPEKLNLEVINGEFTTLYSNYFTNGIHYLGYSFDLTGIDKETFQYAGLLTDLLTNVSTSSKHFRQIHQEIQNLTGGLTFYVSTYNTIDTKQTKAALNVKFSALAHNLDKAQELLLDVINNTNFNDTKRLYERISELNVGLEMSLPQKGHVVGLTRAAGYFDESKYLSDAVEGISYLDFIHDIYVNFENKKEEVISKLTNLISIIFNKNRFSFRFTGNDECLENAKNLAKSFYNTLSENAHTFVSDYKPFSANEGFKTPANVNYVSRVGKYDEPFNGAMHVLNKALSMDYLWMQVRVHGGAYGCMMQTSLNGIIGFTSYRDPEIARTNKVYEDVVEYIENLNPSEEDLLKFKIGAIGGLESVLHVSSKGDLAQSQYLQGITYEMLAKQRKEVITATKEDLIGLAPLFKEVLSQHNLCVIGNDKKIEENKEMFKEVKNLNK